VTFENAHAAVAPQLSHLGRDDAPFASCRCSR
jgi:hypothetical protein